MDIELVQLGKYGRQHHRISGGECVIGREPSCDIRPDHGRVSKRHCRLYRDHGRFYVEDFNSADGTIVNGQRIMTPTPLEDGDELRVGPVAYLVMAGEAEELSSRDDDWVAQTVKNQQGTVRVGSASDSNVIVSPAMETARAILDRIGAEETGHATGAERKPRHGLEVDEEAGVAVARILDRDLIEEMDIRRLSHQLDELIASGRNRIALDFSNVEHCSSQALSNVVQAFERCRAAGGALKLCTVQPPVAELLRMTNLFRMIEIFPETEPALESTWPQPSASGAGSGALEQIEDIEPAFEASASANLPEVRLIVEVGKARGKAIEVTGRRFVIGRDARCQLRPNSETISRVHAIIERREAGVFVRDYGTKNGTLVGGRLLLGEEARASDGDQLQVGILRFKMQIRAAGNLPSAGGDDALAAWLLDQRESTDAEAPTALLIPTLENLASAEPPKVDPHADPSISNAALACEVVNGVLVARIRSSYLDDEATVGPLRYELQTFFDKTLPRRVVLSLEHVDYLSSRAVGVILSFFQHLDREHGALRVCSVSPKILEVLDAMRLPKLVDLYPTAEEAVSDPWI